jgi:HYDIN/CFA65/VesB-like, Ig-like domain
MHPRGLWRAPRRSVRLLVAAMAGLVLTIGLLPAVTGILPGTRVASARANDYMASENAARNGWDSTENPALGYDLTPSTVRTNFTQRWSFTMGGQMYAQPLVIDSLNGGAGEVIMATENDWVDAFVATGANAGHEVWSKHLGSAFVITKSTSSALRGCTDLQPNIGVTGSPVYDPGSGKVYFFANITSGSNVPEYYLITMDPTNGSYTKTPVTGHPTNQSKLTFSAAFQMERPGVLVSGGGVWGAFASHCDKTPYSGYVVRVDLSSGKASLWSDESGLTKDMAGIWQSGGGIVADTTDTSGNSVFLTSGNGISPATGPGNKPPGQLAESVMHLTWNTTAHPNVISPVDFFSPANAPTLDAGDTDLGAGGPVNLPWGTPTASNIIAQPGKDGRIILVNGDNLGGRSSTDTGALFKIQTSGGAWEHPAAFADTASLTSGNVAASHDYLYYIGRNAPLQVFKAGLSSSGNPTLAQVAKSSSSFGFSTGSPVVTSNGTDPTSAVMWVVSSPDHTGANSQLQAFDVSPANLASCGNSCLPIWHSSNFTSTKFSIPATSRGWVYVGTRGSGTAGVLYAYAAKTTTAPVNSATANLPATGVGTTSSQDVSVTATRTVTFTGVSVSGGIANGQAANPFTVHQVTVTRKGTSTPGPVTFPVTLNKGDKLAALVSFAPTIPGGNTGTLSFSTTTVQAPAFSVVQSAPARPLSAVQVPLNGLATREGLTAPNAVAFPWEPDQGVTDVPVGISVPQVITVTNFGTVPQRVTSVTPPSGPFAATGLPAVGTVIKPGQTISVQVVYTPTQAGTDNGSFTIAGSSGANATVALSGIAVPAVSQVTAASPVVNFGTIPVGHQATQYVDITNTGNTATTVQGSSSLPTPFKTELKPPAGMPFNPSYDMAVPISFTPTKKGTFHTTYTLHWTDVNGNHTLTVILTGTAV